MEIDREREIKEKKEGKGGARGQDSLFLSVTRIEERAGHVMYVNVFLQAYT